jgi:hypothetical protein
MTPSAPASDNGPRPTTAPSPLLPLARGRDAGPHDSAGRLRGLLVLIALGYGRWIRRRARSQHAQVLLVLLLVTLVGGLLGSTGWWIVDPRSFPRDAGDALECGGQPAGSRGVPGGLRGPRRPLGPPAGAERPRPAARAALPAAAASPVLTPVRRRQRQARRRSAAAGSPGDTTHRALPLARASPSGPLRENIPARWRWAGWVVTTSSSTGGSRTTSPSWSHLRPPLPTASARGRRVMPLP